MKSLTQVFSDNSNYLEVLVCQIVRLIKDKNFIKMSKREGNFITLNEIVKKHNLKLIDRNINSELTESLPYLTRKTKIYSDKDNNNEAILIASKINNKTPIIYAQQGVFNILGYRFKCQLAENSKILAFNNMIPEMNHNEIEAFYSNNSFDKYCLICLKDRLSACLSVCLSVCLPACPSVRPSVHLSVRFCF